MLGFACALCLLPRAAAAAPRADAGRPPDAGGRPGTEAAPRRAVAIAGPGEAGAITMADFKVRMSNAFSSGREAFAAMHAASGKSGEPGARSSVRLPAFARCAGTFRPPLTSAEAAFAFRGLDANRDGKLLLAEFLEILWTGHFPPDNTVVDEQVQTTVTSPVTSTAAMSATTVTTTVVYLATDRVVVQQEGKSLAISATTVTTTVVYLATDRVVQQEGEALADHVDRFYSLDECKQLCSSSPTCRSFAYFDGDCHLKDRCVQPGDPMVSKSDFRTYFRPCSVPAESYERLGPGYCPHGYYAGGDPKEAVDLATCEAKCSSERRCRFVALRVKDTCSRYGSEANGCLSRTMGLKDHVTYRRRQAGEAAVSEQQAAAASAAAPPAAGEEIISMADFKARMLSAYASSLHAFQALGTNPSSIEDFVRGATTFKPPLTFEQAKYAFRGLDADHDQSLKSFEFFEVIECGHFFPTPAELQAMKGLRGQGPAREMVLRSSQPLTRSAPTTAPGADTGASALPALGPLLGLLACCVGALLGAGLRLAPGLQAGKGDHRESYSAMPSGASSPTSSPSHSLGLTPSQALISL
mmetsp:Transcript_3113/g.9211  ORF Transcript_3113/g.9211 Transcript_3113/m.9211 type:complete len:584 (+) Transcript_3113:3-1754(+)